MAEGKQPPQGLLIQLLRPVTVLPPGTVVTSHLCPLSLLSRTGDTLCLDGTQEHCPCCMSICHAICDQTHSWLERDANTKEVGRARQGTSFPKPC